MRCVCFFCINLIYPIKPMLIMKSSEELTLINTRLSCPKCKNFETYRVPRGFIFKTLMPWVAVKRYKCYKCFNKFYVFN